MQQKSRFLNGVLVLILLLMLGWGGYSLIQPKYPSIVKANDIVPVPRELAVPSLSRQVYSNTVVQDVARLNLFRKQRRKFYRPKPPKPKPQIKRALPKVAVAPPPPPPKPTAPPPQLILTGVMLFNDHKVAIFEGTYSEIRGGRLVQNLKPRRRGYKIGETLGDYKINTIEKSHTTLSATTGNNLTLTISKTPSTQKIQNTGSNLIQKSKSISNGLPRTAPIRRNRKRQAIPIQKNYNKRLPPSATSPPAVSTPGGKVPIPNSLSQKRLQKMRTKPMGF